MALIMNRRTFIKTGILGLTGLTLGCSLPPGNPSVSPGDVTIWINIAEDN